MTLAGLLRRLFGFGSRDVPETRPVTPKPPQKKPTASKPSGKKSPQKLKRSPLAGLDGFRQVAPTPQTATETPASRLGQTPKERASNEGLRPNVSVAKSAQPWVQFGMLDENPVRFTDQEAWWLVEGIWSQITVAEVLDNAVVLSQARYNEMFGDLLQLPSSAFHR